VVRIYQRPRWSRMTGPDSDYVDFKATPTDASGFNADDTDDFQVTGDAEPERLDVLLSPALFAVMGRRSQVGPFGRRKRK